jgi:hypothetical protein
MSSLKTLGVVGIILSALGLIVCCAPDFYINYPGGVFWLFLISAYLLSQSIVGIVKSKTK